MQKPLVGFRGGVVAHEGLHQARVIEAFDRTIAQANYPQIGAVADASPPFRRVGTGPGRVENEAVDAVRQARKVEADHVPVRGEDDTRPGFSRFVAESVTDIDLRKCGKAHRRSLPRVFGTQ